jgi:hypothetical protein
VKWTLVSPGTGLGPSPCYDRRRKRQTNRNGPCSTKLLSPPYSHHETYIFLSTSPSHQRWWLQCTLICWSSLMTLWLNPMNQSYTSGTGWVGQENFPLYLLSDNHLTCAWDSDGRLRVQSRSLTAGNSEHSLWLTPNSANLLSWRLAAVVAEAGPGSRFSASCVRFVLTSYTNGRTSDGVSILDGYGPPIRVIWSWIKLIETWNWMIWTWNITELTHDS